MVSNWFPGLQKMMMPYLLYFTENFPSIMPNTYILPYYLV